MKKNGISLIVLIITVAVALILIGAVVLRARDENISGQAMDVKLANNITVIKEEWNNYLQTEKTNYASEYKRPLSITDINKSSSELASIIPSIAKAGFSEDEFYVLGGDLVYNGDNATVIEKVKEVGGIKFGYTENKEESAWNQPYVPSGYSIIEENGKKLNNINEGFVIQCNTGTYQKGSQFVWVPVKSEEEYRRYYNGFTDEPTDYIDTVGESQKDSIVKYGGFYIGRFEASSSNVQYNNYYNYPSVIKGAKPFNARPDDNGISGVMTSMANAFPNFKATLVTGYMWDITCKWIYDTNSKINKDMDYMIVEKDNVNSYKLLSIGNFDVDDYTSNGYKNTGSSEDYSLNNIYDLSGNTDEITTERNNSNQYVIRGGGCIGLNHRFGILRRDFINSNVTYYGFRYALYIQ